MLRWFHGLPVSRKLTLIGCVFIIPDAVLLTLFLLGVNDGIDFAQQERDGNGYQRPLEQLLQDLPTYQLHAGRDPVVADNGALRDIERRVDAAFFQLEALDARFGQALQVTDDGLAKRNRQHVHVATMKSEWLDLKASGAIEPVTEREASSRHLLSDVRVLITHVGDTSNLILDPDLDSYYLMDVTLLALPPLQSRLASVMALETFAPGQVITRLERTQLAQHAALLRADYDRVMASAKTALNEDVNFHGRSESLQQNVPAALNEFSVVMEDVIRKVETLSQADNAADVAALFRAAEPANEASLRLWRTINEELDGLLARRINSFKVRRARGLSLSALAALSAIGLMTFITRSISGPLQRQAAELRQSNEALRNSMERSEKLIEITNAIPWELDAETTTMSYLSPHAAIVFGPSIMGLVGSPLDWTLVHADDRERARAQFFALASGHNGDRLETKLRVVTRDDRLLYLRCVLGVHEEAGQRKRLRGVTVDITAGITQQMKHDLELRQAQKLESVGRLAAGVAHEINTPLQFINDNVQFVHDASTDLLTLVARYQSALRAASAGGPVDEAAARIADAEVDADLPYLTEHMPLAISRAIEGLQRVAAIVRSMKEFAHPQETEMAPVDLNRAIQSTLTVARHEYKYVADVETDFGDLPAVTCSAGAFNQVILNIVVNAAHAIEATAKAPDAKGRIVVRTRAEVDDVEIRVSDTGGGIPADVQQRIFDPFFTTKEVGKGSGQGLAIARAVIVEKHGGSLTCESQAGTGTTFIIRLPINGRRREAAA